MATHNISQTFTKRFQALGTTVEGGIRTDAKAAQMVFDEIEQQVKTFESKFSRFRGDSELSMLNANAGQVVTVSEDLMELLSAARDTWLMTEGIVDPTIGQALITAGYDQSFETLSQVSERTHNTSPAPRRTMADVDLDEKNRTVVIPPGMVMDLGGIGKGFLADRLIRRLEKISNDFWWSLGGDITVSGTDADGQPWTVGVQDPRHLEKDVYNLKPPAGCWGIATSGIAKRRGVRNGQAWHHIIDPRTGQPATTDIVAVTAMAPRALEADVAAKTILILGAKSGLTWLRRHQNFEALIIKSDSTTVTTDRMTRLLQIL
ncbi:MAG: FAD:protein FMN transferase [Patescibacteria group bacterium]|jgi:thiamine biosynthesis lipoprotein